MLPKELYNLVIEEEKKGVCVKNLRVAARSVAKAYSKKALGKGDTYVNYNEPEYRCAYLYKYSCLHTQFVTKFFRKFCRKKAVKNILFKKKDIKISCLGGGPGTDIVGIFRALAINPGMHQKVSEANVLDICVGWHHSFNHIINYLISGNINDIPPSFVKDNFQANFVEVDLLEPLPIHVKNIISNSDIICMVKFISAVLRKDTFPKALKALAELFKVGTVILFIDNFKGNVVESMEIISNQAGLEIVLGPEVETLVNKADCKMEIFSCEPLKAARVTVIGLIKTESEMNKSLNNLSLNYMPFHNKNNTSKFTVECTNFIDGSSAIESTEDLSYSDIYYDKYTQTDYLPNNKEESFAEIQELSSLITALSELIAVVTQLQLNQQYSICR